MQVFVRSKIRPVPPVRRKRKVEPCKFSSVQKFVQFHRSGANARWNRASFRPFKNSSSSTGPAQTQGGTVQVFVRSKIRPVPPVLYCANARWNRASCCPCKNSSSSTGPVQTQVVVPEKFVQFHRSGANARWNRASFRPFKNSSSSTGLVQTQGGTVQVFVPAKIASCPVPPVRCKRKVETVQVFVRSKIRPVPPVRCKRKLKPCKLLSLQKFVRSGARVNEA